MSDNAVDPFPNQAAQDQVCKNKLIADWLMNGQIFKRFQLPPPVQNAICSAHNGAITVIRVGPNFVQTVPAPPCVYLFAP
jgi:hypothetical protein